MSRKILFIIVCTTLILSMVNITTVKAQMGGFGGGRGGRGGGMGGGRGGMGGMDQTTELVKLYDKDGNGWLNTEERKAARQSSMYRQQGGMGGFGMGGYQSPGTIGPKLTPADVMSYSKDVPLYDIKTLRTIFLEFEDSDWESELEAFYHTDVEVPVKMTVDGQIYENVGVRFRGNTSYQMASRGQKRPLNITMDLVDTKQRLYGYSTLNLLTSNSDPTFLRQVLYQQISRTYYPSLNANYIRLVINGESWGIYINLQQFSTEFTKEAFGSAKGARWKVPVNMGGMRGGGGGSGMAYLGENAASYKSFYEIKGNDDPNSWAALINLCRVLNQTPANKLEEALKPILDIDGVLRYLAVDNVFINSDGYWTRASDYLIYQDKDGRFHIIPNDTSETMNEAEGGRGGGGGFGMGGGGLSLDPLAGSTDSGKPLLSKLLAVPSLRQRYLGYIRDIAENWLTWEKIGPIARQYQALIAADIQKDTRKLSSTQAFSTGLTQDNAGSSGEFFGGGRGGFGGGASISLKSFVEERGKFLLSLQQVKQAPLPKK
jgi:spore coat protein CotH